MTDEVEIHVDPAESESLLTQLGEDLSGLTQIANQPTQECARPATTGKKTVSVKM